MYIYTALCAFVLITLSGVESRKCSDCTNYKQCPSAVLALNKRDRETRELFRVAYCGRDLSGDQVIVKVCCSVFPSEDQETAEDVEIRSHPNLALLPASCGKIEPRRVGGVTIYLYEFPWLALISYKIGDVISFQCGGSIINQRYILTAAHCVYGMNITGVRVGEYDTSQDSVCQFGVCESYIQDILVEKAIVHQDYHSMPIVVNDIALLRVSVPMDFEHKNVQPICLPKTAKLLNKPLDNLYATVAGWGLTDNGAPPSIPRMATIPIHAADRCYSLLNRYTRPGAPDAASQLCAGADNMDSCVGDSGGPLMVEESYHGAERYVQYGVVSYARGQRCGFDSPGVYTAVTKYMGWILDNMAP